MKYIKVIIFLLLAVSLNTQGSFSYGACFPKIAVIGEGIGGASASHFLAELFKDNINIHSFESKTVGGRLATVKIGTHEYEAGGAVIHPRNKYMKDFAKLLNLKDRPPVDSKFGIWNGDEFVFEEGDWQVTTIAKLLHRYGLDPIYLHRYIDKILDDFEKIYDLQDKGIGFENVTALLCAMNKEFPNLLQKSIKKHLTQLGYGSKIINELVEATLVVNYGQDTNVQAFVSSVSVAGAGFDLWSVEGGNKQVPIHLLLNNKKVINIQSTVKKIRRQSHNKTPLYEIVYDKNGEEVSDTYDIVIIASPMTNDQENKILLEGFQNSDIKFEGQYQTTYATFVAGNVNASYFGLEKELGGILSCNPLKTKISSIGKLSSVEGIITRTPVWKIFTRDPIDDWTLKKMFLQIEEKKEIKWKAYPKYSSTTKLEKFKLDDFLYHVNAIEWSASAMEMSAIGGRNVAILAFNDYKKKCSLPSQNDILENFHDEDHTSEL